MTKYAFTINNMYSSEQIRMVKWWNRLVGFPGETVVCKFATDEADHFRAAVLYFRSKGHEAKIMGMKLFEGIV